MVVLQGTQLKAPNEHNDKLCLEMTGLTYVDGGMLLYLAGIRCRRGNVRHTEANLRHVFS